MNEFPDVIDLVITAGQKLKKNFGRVEVLGYKTTYSSSAVTKVDKETEAFLKGNLKKLYPDVGFKGEEFGGSEKQKKFWLVDPIDGTGLFVRGLWGCVTMLALIEDEEIVFSVIYDFILDKLYQAQKGRGAFLNNKPIKVSRRNLSQALIYFESKLATKKEIDTFLALDKKCNVLGNYPAGIHFSLTAEGKIEGRVCMNPYGEDYDFAPGQLLVQEAGGVVANIGSSSFDFRNLNFLAVNKEVYKDLTKGETVLFPIPELA